MGEPIKSTIEAMIKLKEKGHSIFIFTTRLDTPHLRDWLKENNVPYDGINEGKHNPLFARRRMLLAVLAGPFS